MNSSPLLRLLAVCTLALAAAPLPAASDYPVQPVPFTDVRFTSGLLAARQATNNDVTLPFALAQCESSKRLTNFDLAAEVMRRRAAGETNFQIKPPTQYPFDDSDVYKVLEGAAFCLSVKPNPALVQQLDALIARIAAAQEPDGYLYTWRTMHPDSPAHKWIDPQRWLKDPEVSHELYNIGHLYEAGVPYLQATGNSNLLAICLRSAELVWKDFGDGSRRIAPGHQVIEMGMVKLYRQTGDPRWLKLAQFFIDVRGNKGGVYNQNHIPAVDQREAVGHAVRANYLYAGMADVAALTGDPRYFTAINAIWSNVVSRKLHLTGGCGARAAGEAYGDDYELPNRCYNETCAAIAFLFWNHRMFLMTGDARYMDLFERSLYNGVLSGISLSGDRFFYPNPLEYDGVTKNNHGYAGRAPWFGCACCPPNLLRLIASLGGYALAVKDDILFVNLYAAGSATATVAGNQVRLTQTTGYPWTDTITFKVNPAKPGPFTLALRLPGWVEGRPLPSDLYAYDNPEPAAWSVKVNGETVTPTREAGFARLTRDWKAGDTVELTLPLTVRRVKGNDQVAALRGLVALERGPIVYCLEGIDNPDGVFNVVLPAAAAITPRPRPDLLGGVTTLEITGALRGERNARDEVVTRPATLTAIPYAVWNNRGLHSMTTWLPRSPDLIRRTLPPSPATTARVTASFARPGLRPEAANDRLTSLNHTDGFAENFNFWPHKGTTEWLQYEFAQPAAVSGATVMWFDDTGRGECRAPAAWRILYQDAAGQWQPVVNPSAYGTAKDAPQKVTFDPVTTKRLRLEVTGQPKFSTGLYEWELH